ncbi:MAG: hypothetical protein JWM11_2719 [Planctomycetaceae bacterium]|nr:hypothetical protein [Planctomycetaceae bacterium]
MCARQQGRRLNGKGIGRERLPADFADAFVSLRSADSSRELAFPSTFVKMPRSCCPRWFYPVDRHASERRERMQS